MTVSRAAESVAIGRMLGSILTRSSAFNCSPMVAKVSNNRQLWIASCAFVEICGCRWRKNFLLRAKATLPLRMARQGSAWFAVDTAVGDFGKRDASTQGRRSGARKGVDRGFGQRPQTNALSNSPLVYSAAILNKLSSCVQEQIACKSKKPACVAYRPLRTWFSYGLS